MNIEYESDYLYRIRRELEDRITLIAEEKMNEKVSKLHWRYGSLVGAFIIGAAILGYTQMSDIPNKIENALTNEATLNTIEQIKEKGKKVDEIYTTAFNHLTALEDNYKSVSDSIVKDLKQDVNFQKRIMGIKGEPGKDGINGKDGIKGKDGINGKDGKDGKDGIYANLATPEEVGRFEVVKSQGKSILTFTDVTKESSIEFVTFILGAGFENPIVSPKRDGKKFTYLVTNVRFATEITAIVYYKTDPSGRAHPYLFNVTLNP